MAANCIRYRSRRLARPRPSGLKPASIAIAATSIAPSTLQQNISETAVSRGPIPLHQDPLHWRCAGSVGLVPTVRLAVGGNYDLAF